MSLVTRKPVFRGFDQIRLKPVCSSKEAIYSNEIANIDTRDIILSRQRTTKVLIGLRGRGGAIFFFFFNILVLDMQEKNKMAQEGY